MFTNTKINITIDGRKHLGAVVGSDTYKVQFVENLVNNWNTQLKLSVLKITVGHRTLSDPTSKLSDENECLSDILSDQFF